MRVIACLAPVIDSELAEYDLANDRLCNIYLDSDPIAWQVLEEALRLKENGTCNVTALSVSPDSGIEVLRRFLLQGADRAVRVWQEQFGEVDAWIVAEAMGQVIEKIGFDLVLCGTRSSDYASEFMGYALAGILGIPCITGVIGLKLEQGNKLTVHKKIQMGRRVTYRISLPTVLGLEDGINEPRYVAPFSKSYRTGLGKNVEYIEADIDRCSTVPLLKTLRLAPSRPRVKVGLDVSAMSMQQRLKMMRGELGRKKEMYHGGAGEAAKKILSEIKDALS
jgi:electron transfer flavoprotein beta subunit